MQSKIADSDARAGRRRRRSRDDAPAVRASTAVSGGRYAPLDSSERDAIHAAALDILATVGMSDAPDLVAASVLEAGGRLAGDGRLTFPPEMVERAIEELPRSLMLPARDPGHDLVLSHSRVYVGTGGAAPMVVDLETDTYRPSTLRDLFDASRLVDRLENIHFFARPVVACDVEEPEALDINTAFASLAGTTKHVIVSAHDAAHVRAIARMCHLIAGSEAAFRERPFLSLNINHVVPPLRFSGDACAVLAEAVRLGIPAHVNTFGQMGASSPVTIAGCVAQTIAETLAGVVFAWTLDPAAKVTFGPRPMVTDLRTGGMAGGAGEQAVLTAAVVQIAQHYGLPNSTIAGATDSKIADAQSGYEKCLSVNIAAQTGANMITQACGMQAGLMGCSFESYVIDNEMLGAILRTMAPIEVNAATLSAEAIGEVVRGAGHFLGHADTLARMQSDFLYPQIADRRAPEEWQAAGAPDIRQPARARAREILETHFPAPIPPATEAAIRAEFDIRLPEDAMRPA
ncbi:trimethylamine methyltransferase family protein [Paralimibaculum aggregatum]|uniref:trimethylamine methyltransferase family protein n=1 Tax=Paralimibaculum aggregatum TaxID=3036245 RepID=UPI002557B382|nr:trimethylamine methyltransferase family protein [Limibaculum sp. NKW23]